MDEEKKKRIDELIKFFGNLLINNPDYIISSSEIHEQIVKSSSKTISIKSFFNDWINYFSKKDNIDVSIDPNWSFFCQFKNDQQSVEANPNHLKIYIPLDFEHIFKGAIYIFEFLSKNNIKHMSKISQRISCDDIVIRLTNPLDLHKLINFVNSNYYIKEGLLKPNPFAFNYKGIALACDGFISYTETISEYIKLYLNKKRKEQTLKDVSCDDFFTFVKNCYKYFFSTQEGLSYLTENFTLGNYKDDKEIIDYEDTSRLIIKVNTTAFTYDDYLNHYIECCNLQKIKAKIKQLDKFKNKPKTSIWSR